MRFEAFLTFALVTALAFLGAVGAAFTEPVFFGLAADSEAPPIFFTEPIISLTINSTVYNKVRKIAIPTNPYPNVNSSLKGLTFIYYDQNKGIVGFDDVENNMWRLQN